MHRRTHSQSDQQHENILSPLKCHDKNQGIFRICLANKSKPFQHHYWHQLFGQQKETPQWHKQLHRNKRADQISFFPTTLTKNPDLYTNNSQLQEFYYYICFTALFLGLQCFDAVGWAAGRASGL